MLDVNFEQVKPDQPTAPNDSVQTDPKMLPPTILGFRPTYLTGLSI
jgi:hypothetical protein